MFLDKKMSISNRPCIDHITTKWFLLSTRGMSWSNPSAIREISQGSDSFVPFPVNRIVSILWCELMRFVGQIGWKRRVNTKLLCLTTFTAGILYFQFVVIWIGHFWCRVDMSEVKKYNLGKSIETTVETFHWIQAWIQVVHSPAACCIQ